MRLFHGDCLEKMREIGDGTIDSIVTDPPYGLSFMGKGWDHGVPGSEFWVQALRVAKPGTHLLAFGGTRTYHRLAVAIEDAGWEIRDCVMWVYGSGFPKSHDVSKAIDKAAGVEREVVGTGSRSQNLSEGWDRPWKRAQMEAIDGSGMAEFNITAPATEAAKQWDGWGTALKPAWEPIIVARKPLIGTVAENVLKYGAGGLNIEGCRVGTRTDNESGWSKTGSKASENRSMSGANYDREAKDEAGNGRWPANLIHDGSEEVLDLFPEKNGAHGGRGHFKQHTWAGNGKETNQDIKRDNGGSAARFFYCAKASKRDRDEGCEGLELRKANKNGSGLGRDCSLESRKDENGDDLIRARNHHPTVKPTDLMRYLCRLVTPPKGIVLDPFMGSGSTGKAAVLEGFDFVGVEKEADYIKIAEARIAKAKAEKQEQLL